MTPTQNNFLNSGLTLEAGPSDIIRRAFTAGQKDIDRIVTNANTRSKNTISQARTKALEGFASMAKGIDFGGNNLVSNTLDDFGAGVQTAWEGYGYGVGSDLSASIRDNGSIF